MDEHDTSYKLLFSHDRMVREWVAALDLGSLQKMNGSYVTDDLRGRHGDAIWRIRWGEEWAERRLPPVLPVVLYNGERRWRAPTVAAFGWSITGPPRRWRLSFSVC